MTPSKLSEHSITDEDPPKNAVRAAMAVRQTSVGRVTQMMKAMSGSEEKEGLKDGKVAADAPSVRALRDIVEKLLVSVGEAPREPEGAGAMDEDVEEEPAAGAAAAAGGGAAAKEAELERLRSQMRALQLQMAAVEAS